MIEVMEELKRIGDLYKQQNYSIALDKLDDLWNSIPEPKFEIRNSFLIIMYGVKVSLILNNLEKAWAWAVLAPEYNKGRQDIGEAEFIVGMVAFERGELEIAVENFKIANKKSGGRAFHGEDPKYKAIII